MDQTPEEPPSFPPTPATELEGLKGAAETEDLATEEEQAALEDVEDLFPTVTPAP